MSNIGWFDRPRDLAVSHLLGAAALGLCVGFVIAVNMGPDPVSSGEIRDLTVVPRSSVAFPDRLKFGPYFCEGDCAGHSAGWDWGRAKRAKSTDDCSGSGSTSFHEGCLFYVQVRGYEEDEW